MFSACHSSRWFAELNPVRGSAESRPLLGLLAYSLTSVPGVLTCRGPKGDLAVLMGTLPALSAPGCQFLFPQHCETLY